MAEVFLHRILVPVDNSLSNLMAQETAAYIAKKTGATVTILHVIPEFRTIYEYSQSVGSEVVFSEEKRSESILSKASTLFEEENVPNNILTGRGDPAVTILEYATTSYDLVIMGACGEHESDLCKLGSVTKKVERHVHRPILVAKKISLLTNFLVCTDGSEHSVEALAFAAKLARKLEAKITILNVQEGLVQNISPKTAKEIGELVLTSTLNAVEGEKLEVTKIVEYGTPSNVISDLTSEGKFDLVVLGSRGLGTAERFLLGSVSDDVSYSAQCSVLIVPPRS
jgi:nucleotide-binding universal stress UspA family protein